MAQMKIEMDGRTYSVRITFPSMERSFELISGKNAGLMLSGREERDLLGTQYAYQMHVEPDPLNPEDYDAFYSAISSPVDTHEITLPFGQSTITYNAKVASGRDFYRGTLGGKKRWGSLTVAFEAIEPQVVAE